jgi:hypothetical protein
VLSCVVYDLRMSKLSDYFRACSELGAWTDGSVTEAEAFARAERIAAGRERAELKRRIIERGGQP